MSKNITIIMDDDDIIPILKKHNLLFNMQALQHLPSTKRNGQNQCAAKFFHEDEAGEYYCMATFHWGQEVETENGFALCMIAATDDEHTKDEAYALFEKILSGFGNRSDVLIIGGDKDEA